MSLPPSFIQTLVLCLLMAVGFAAGNMYILDESSGRSICRLLVNFILPALIVESMQRPFTRGSLWRRREDGELPCARLHPHLHPGPRLGTLPRLAADAVDPLCN